VARRDVSTDATLYIAARHFPSRLSGVPPSVLEEIAASAKYPTSQSAAWTLLALDAYAKAAGKPGTAEIKDGKATLHNPSNLAAYYAINETGFDRNAPNAAISNGIEVFHEFLDPRTSAVISQVKVGEEFLVRLRVRTTKLDRENQVAVVDLLPGGTEPVLELRPAQDTTEPDADPAQQRQRTAHSSLPIGLPDKSTWQPQHADVRDDRIILYGDLTRDTATFVYRARATNAGTFQSPGAFSEALYDPKTNGVSAPTKLEVVKP
jgi:uncharacterized protein YfaS (alpha-2-macroglobulin family)